MTQFHDVHANKDGVFNTGSGKLINIKKPTIDMICIEDIADALSKICRFGGHANDFYSVAQHSCIVAALAPDHLCREALLHDAAEAYLGDVIKPLKNILGTVYDELEYEFMKVIIQKFKLDVDNLMRIKEYDKHALSIEHRRFIVGDHCYWYQRMKEINAYPLTLDHVGAKRLFLGAYQLFFEL